MISEETKQKILDAARVEEVVGDFVSLRRRGAELWGCCPFHNEKTPSFHVVPARDLYYCFGCHKGGSAIGFVMEHEHMNYGEALRYLAKKYGIEIHEEDENPEVIARRQHRESLFLVSEYASKFFQKQLGTPEGKSVGLAYFHSRGLEDSTIEKYGLGWAPSGRTNLADEARSAGYKGEYLLETGLCAENEQDHSLRDRFYDRVVFPIHSVSGRVIAFGARTLKSKVEGKQYSKYVNSKESDIYVKNMSLYGIWFAKNEISKKDRCYLVEGYLDVLSMHQLGICNVVASSGTALTEGQVNLIKRFSSNVTIMYDGDEAGIHAAMRGIDMFLEKDMNVKVVLIPDGDDPDSYSRKHTLEEVETFLRDSERDFVDFKSSILMDGTKSDPVARANSINEICDTVALIPDPVKRTVYIEFLSEKFGIDKDVLNSRVAVTRRRKLAQKGRENDSGPQDVSGTGKGSNDGDIVQPPVPSGTHMPSGLDALEEDHQMGKAERDLLNFILTGGTEILEFQRDSEFFVESDEEKQTVYDFIAQALEDDGVQFTNNIYRKIFDEYSKLYYQGDSQEAIVKKLMDAEDRDIAAATNLLFNDEQYQITVKGLKDSMMNRSSWFARYVPKSILVFQQCRLESELLRLQAAIAQFGEDVEKAEETLKKIQKIQALRKSVMVKIGREKN